MDKFERCNGCGAKSKGGEFDDYYECEGGYYYYECVICGRKWHVEDDRDPPGED